MLVMLHYILKFEHLTFHKIAYFFSVLNPFEKNCYVIILNDITMLITI